MTSFRNRLFLVIVGVVLAVEALTMVAALRARSGEPRPGSFSPSIHPEAAGRSRKRGFAQLRIRPKRLKRNESRA